MLEYILSTEVIIELVNNPTVFFLLVGLFFVSVSFICRYLWQTGRNELVNDKYTPKRSINQITERQNKYNWK